MGDYGSPQQPIICCIFATPLFTLWSLIYPVIQNFHVVYTLKNSFSINLFSGCFCLFTNNMMDLIFGLFLTSNMASYCMFTIKPCLPALTCKMSCKGFSNSGQIFCIHFCTNVFGKGMEPFLLLSYNRLNKAGQTLFSNLEWQPI